MTLKTRRILLAATLAALLALAASPLACADGEAHYDVDRADYPIKGIDVSAHNGVIDFEQARADSVEFVYIKATEGTDFCDAAFARNYVAASRAGLKTGAYHYFRFDSPGSEQAAHFLGAVGDLGLDLPLGIDVEDDGNARAESSSQVAAELRAMAAALQEQGRRVVIYTNRKGLARYVEAAFDGSLPIWIASPSRPPSGRGWVLWQHSHKGAVRGVRGAVDLNTFNGDSAAFRAWIGS